ncbi:embryonic testis differentiation protein-like [Mesocricetus auratus]|uniref:Embryonic testis differentiation protein-like n=1 Tax=Mesocricetus auratus TaxID=10036 RepID=A0ABM2XAH7_MESAU|nr:embryonic testis differentiation protein-like [Mesocricetus auratus]
MDREKPEASPSSSESNMEQITPRELKGRKPSNNILIYLIDRQLGRPRNHMNLFEWVCTIA